MNQRRIRFYAALIGAGLLAGCQNAPTPVPGTAPAAGTPADEKPVVILKQPDNSIVHSASGMRFPERVGDFKRVSWGQSGLRDRYFTCEYKSSVPGEQVAATVFIYPAPSVTANSTEGLIRETRPAMADSEYQTEVKRVRAEHPQATGNWAKEISLAQGVQRKLGRCVEFDYTDLSGHRPQPVTSRLYLFNDADDRWAVKFNVTFPKGFPADKLIGEFMAELHWTLRDT